GRRKEERKEEWKKERRVEERKNKGKKSEQEWLWIKTVKRDSKKKERKWNEAERWSVRESRVRGIERKIWKKKVEYGRCLNIPSYTVEWRGTGERGALEPCGRWQWSTGASQFNDPIMMS